METDQFLGINCIYTSEYKAGSSKFYGFLFPVKNSNDFELKIKEYKEEFADATHVCSACVIGLQRDYKKFSDDGEPSNSSGRPILNALLSNNLTFIGCAVVRYYGGKKLGIPGLIDAYGGAAMECIDKAEIVTKIVSSTVECQIPLATSYLLYNYLARNKHYTYNSAGNKFEIECSQSMTASLRTDLNKIDNLVILNED